MRHGPLLLWVLVLIASFLPGNPIVTANAQRDIEGFERRCVVVRRGRQRLAIRSVVPRLFCGRLKREVRRRDRIN
jgi:hypothetical protein